MTNEPPDNGLPGLAEPHDLDPALVDAFRRDGHVAVPGLASPAEAAAYRPRIERAALETAWDTRPLEERDTYGRAFLQSFNLWRVDPAIATFTRSPRFAAVAAGLLGVDRVRLYHDQALCKEPGGGPTPWHQDQNYWPMDTDATVTMWMPLVDLPDEVGSMTFVSGSHRHGDLQGGSIGDDSDASFAGRIAAEGWATASHGALRAGDATFHTGWTVHSAGPNPTDLLRTVMTVIYVADGARIRSDLTEAQDLDRQIWCRGAAPGAAIDSDLNPVL